MMMTTATTTAATTMTMVMLAVTPQATHFLASPIHHRFIHSFIHSCIHPSLIRSFVHSFIHSFLHPSNRLFARLLRSLWRIPSTFSFFVAVAQAPRASHRRLLRAGRLAAGAPGVLLPRGLSPAPGLLWWWQVAAHQGGPAPGRRWRRRGLGHRHPPRLPEAVAPSQPLGDCAVRVVGWLGCSWCAGSRQAVA
jgi:hypothetical protein